MRVIDRVHADRGRAVVFRDGYSAAKAHFKPGTGAATAAEEIHDNLIVLRVKAKALLGFEIEGVFLLVCRHEQTSPGGVMLNDGGEWSRGAKLCGLSLAIRSPFTEPNPLRFSLRVDDWLAFGVSHNAKVSCQLECLNQKPHSHHVLKQTG